ncbi:diphthine synthase [archaeon]|nr:MAG: diphthine synthase [archaeon]
MLTLIGLGLHDEKDITLRGIDAAKNADKVYIELYTGKWFGSLDRLEEIVGKDIVELKRSDLEENSNRILDEAAKKDIAIFMQGDPLVITTHNSLIADARKMKIDTKVIHNASIFSSIAETGLHVQKFGPSVAISFPEKTKGKLPESVYKTILDNKKRGLHTLCLLDLVDGKVMEPKDALKILQALDKEKMISDVIVASRLGGKSKIVSGKIGDIMDVKFEEPSVVVIVGNLHFTEKEFLNI